MVLLTPELCKCIVEKAKQLGISEVKLSDGYLVGNYEFLIYFSPNSQKVPVQVEAQLDFQAFLKDVLKLSAFPKVHTEAALSDAVRTFKMASYVERNIIKQAKLLSKIAEELAAALGKNAQESPLAQRAVITR